MQASAPARRDLVLVGGGHSHVLALKKLAMRPAEGLRITLISPAAFTPYSGMLPGLLAGHYRFEEAHIDLARLCQWANVRFLPDRVEALDPDARRLRCARRGEIGYDLLSIDIGSQPELDSVPGAREFALPVKPVAGLWARWQQLIEERSLAGSRIAVVGGGAGSVEIALAIAHRLRDQRPKLALYCGSAQLLPGYRESLRRAVEQQLESLGVELYRDHRVSRVSEEQLHFEDASTATFDTLIWCTGAAAAPWIAGSGLPVDERGFMLVRDSLQSTGYANVFGAGDIATQQDHPRPKAGVYAVRQAPALAENLRACYVGEALREHRPQSDFLSMLSLGPKRAVAQRGPLHASGAWVWRWKDHIDRKFMNRFEGLSPRQMGSAQTTLSRQAPCGGCGAKVAADVLGDVLRELRERYPQHTPGSDALDDAALVDAAAPLMQSLDALRGLVDDPWRMGRIAAQHALSDLYASGARPHSVLALVTLPFAETPLLRRDLRMVLDGALSVLREADCQLLGGHSMQGPELQLGFAVNGVLDGLPPLRKRAARIKDQLLLTRPLGSGALFAAHMQAQADGRDVDAALSMMELGNAEASRVARRFGAHAVTDVTGFGLAGHLVEMLTDAQGAILQLSRLPALSGALQAMHSGIFSTLHAPNRAAVASACAASDAMPVAAQLLFDPQTSGGLLMALPSDQAAAALSALQSTGHNAALIGEVREAGEAAGSPRITLLS